MTPRPVHRWKSFWLGVVVLGFLLWAAWKSQRMGHILTMVGKDQGVQVVKLKGGTVFMSGPSIFMNWGDRPERVMYESQPIEADRWIGFWEEMRFVGVRMVKVPDRLVFFGFLGLWGGWLIWQWSREQRKVE